MRLSIMLYFSVTMCAGGGMEQRGLGSCELPSHHTRGEAEQLQARSKVPA